MIDFEQEQSMVTPAVRISVLGVGGAGGNTVNALLATRYENVSCVTVNTDLKALEVSRTPVKLQIGIKSARGLGAGANPELGRRAAEEDLAEILESVKGSDIVFLTGGLGGGTGSGALPVIARALKERDLLCIAVVTKPFSFEGKRRMKVAEDAELLLKKEVDTLITIPNEKLLTMTDAKLSLVHAFEMVNDIIADFVKSVADIIAKPGYINVDFADVKAIMKGMGLAVMGTGRGQGADRAIQAAQAAIASPLLDNVSIKGARSVLINVTGSADLGLLEVSQAASLITAQAHEDANVILGSVIDDTMHDEVSVTVIATGFSPMMMVEKVATKIAEKEMVSEQPAVVCAEKVDAQDVPVMTSKHPLQDILLDSKDMASVHRRENDLEVPTLLRKMIQEKRLQEKELK